MVQVGIGEAFLQTPPTRPRRGPAILDQGPCAGGAGTRTAFIYQQCWYCEPEFGREDEQCAAVASLEQIKADLEEVSRRVEGEEAESGVSALARKNARYVMYRAWVGDKWGKLGRGNRIRIPPCVVEYIRNCFREPGCVCRMGGPLFACKDYTGHRDPPGRDE